MDSVDCYLCQLTKKNICFSIHSRLWTSRPPSKTGEDDFFTRSLFRPCSLVFTFTSISILKSSFQGQFFFYSLGCSMDHVTRRERAMMNMLKHVPVIGDLAKKLIIERRNQAAGPAPTVVCITHSAHPHRPVGTRLLTGLDIPTDRQTQAH